MPRYVEVGTGAIGINWSKDAPTQPDYRGKFTLDGRNFTVSAWKKFRNGDGREFFSFNISEVLDDGKPEPKSEPKPTHATPKGNLLDDDIPF